MMAKTSRKRNWAVVLLALLLAAVVSAPFILRSRTVIRLEQQYKATPLGQSLETVLRLTPLAMHVGTPPERYRNDVWWRTAGDRASCRSWGVIHGGMFSSNYSLIVGFDARGRVAFKAIGNT